jgi:hypothetical protein
VTALAAAIVDWGALGKVVLWSLVAGVGVTLCYALAIRGAIRYAELRRADRGGVAVFYGVLSFAGLAATVGAIVVAIVVMTQKS